MPLDNFTRFITKLSTSPLFASFFVLIFPLLTQNIFSDFVREGEYNARIGWFILIACAAMAVRSKWLLVALIIPFLFGGLLDISYAIAFGGIFTTATIEAIANTDSGEVGEFVSAYSSFTLWFFILAYLSISSYLLTQVKLTFLTRKKALFASALSILLLLVVGHRTLILNKYHDSIPGVLGSLPSYYQSHISIEDEVTLRENMVASITEPAVVEGNHEQTHILIIGESLSRHHMSLYGYNRNTTPNLDNRTDLYLLDNAISSHAQTQASLRVALTSAQANEGNHYRSMPSIIDMANKADYQTWWISNQQPMRATIASISLQAKKAHYISNDYHGVEVHRHDDLMLPVIEKAMNHPSEKKLIVIHMMGSHAQYRNRYPETFNPEIEGIVTSEKIELDGTKKQTIHEYDLSVRYTDLFIHNVLSLLQNNIGDRIGSLTFISDHGEEVYQTKDLKGHSPDNVSQRMFDIPLFVWLSDTYKSNNPDVPNALSQNKSSPFVLDNLYHLTLDLINVQTSTLIDSKSPASLTYSAPGKRVLYGKQYSDLD